MTLLTRSAETTSPLQRQLTQGGRRRVRIYADHFGSYDCKPADGDYIILESRFWPGSSTPEVYLVLQNTDGIVTEVGTFTFFSLVIVDFVTDMMKASGAALFNGEDEVERSRTEKGILHCIQRNQQTSTEESREDENEDEEPEE
ncbi:hypothetical protein Aduo_012592 [Ancylostoma duodenale]